MFTLCNNVLQVEAMLFFVNVDEAHFDGVHRV
jgi:hypothetical protein